MRLLLTSQAFDALSRGSVLSHAPDKGGIVTVPCPRDRNDEPADKTRQTWANLLQARNIRNTGCGDGWSRQVLVHTNGYYSAFSAGPWLLAPPTGSLITHSDSDVQGLQLLLLMTQVLYFAESLHDNSWSWHHQRSSTPHSSESEPLFRSLFLIGSFLMETVA